MCIWLHVGLITSWCKIITAPSCRLQGYTYSRDFRVRHGITGSRCLELGQESWCRSKRWRPRPPDSGGIHKAAHRQCSHRWHRRYAIVISPPSKLVHACLAGWSTLLISLTPYIASTLLPSSSTTVTVLLLPELNFLRLFLGASSAIPASNRCDIVFACAATECLFLHCNGMSCNPFGFFRNQSISHAVLLDLAYLVWCTWFLILQNLDMYVYI